MMSEKPLLKHLTKKATNNLVKEELVYLVGFGCSSDANKIVELAVYCAGKLKRKQ